jgi:glutamate 5-kinase
MLKSTRIFKNIQFTKLVFAKQPVHSGFFGMQTKLAAAQISSQNGLSFLAARTMGTKSQKVVFSADPDKEQSTQQPARQPQNEKNAQKSKIGQQRNKKSVQNTRSQNKLNVRPERPVFGSITEAKSAYYNDRKAIFEQMR